MTHDKTMSAGLFMPCMIIILLQAKLTCHPAIGLFGLIGQPDFSVSVQQKTAAVCHRARCERLH